jgi:hypothetical protein
MGPRRLDRGSNDACCCKPALPGGCFYRRRRVVVVVDLCVGIRVTLDLRDPPPTIPLCLTEATRLSNLSSS